MKSIFGLSFLLISFASLSAYAGSDKSVLVAIMDSGTDISHHDLVQKAWLNPNEQEGSLDIDGDGLPGDIHGWDFTENSPNVFNDKYNYLITDDVKKFYDYYSKYELGKLSRTSPEVAWLSTKMEDKGLMNEVNFVGGYVHGTHVAGISLLNIPNAKVISFKIIPTDFQELSHHVLKVSMASLLSLKSDEQDASLDDLLVGQFIGGILNAATQKVEQMALMHGLLKFHRVDVVNQSFGIGYPDALNMVKSGFIETVKRDPTDIELQVITDMFFEALTTEGPKMFASAPDTVFAIAAGNDSLDNDLVGEYPGNIEADNKIVVAATLGYKSLAEFSNFGATKVDVAAPGVAISSTAPTDTYLSLSGTSQATPFVTNIIAAVKDANPALSALDLKAIVLGTVDVKSWLSGKVKTSGIVNKSRALKAAELSKTQSIDLAISNSRLAVSDVAIEKSLNLRPAGLKFRFKPVLPSLLRPIK